MSAHAFIFNLLVMLVLLGIAIFSGPISAAAVRFFYGTANRRRK
jgi:hypothetical protein